MGASTVLNFLKIYGEDSLIKSSIKSAILDSPFVSFEQIAKETVAKNMGLPAFVCSPLVNVTINKVLEKYGFNLKALNFSNLKNISYPAVFIYSEKDEIVDCSHSISIIKQYGGAYSVIKSSFQHNETRSENIILQVFNLLKNNK